jgi:putative peptide zinc metalloprotease protein
VEPTSPAGTERPRLRRDLEFTHRQAGGATEVIVCDPRTGRYFRAGELEAALFALLDGETELSAIATRMASEFDGLPAEDIPAFVGQIDRLGFLESSVVAAAARLPLYRRLLYAQLRIANPDRLFARLIPSVGWLYRPVGWAAVAALFLVAGAVAAVSQEEVLRQAAATDTPGFWLRLWLGLSLVSTLHEFGHGLTCRFFGGRSTGIGLLWMYGLPCFYCDVSGAWMLPKKSQRIWVGAAGLYYQFIAGAVALLLWRVLEPGTFASDLLLAMAASCGLLSLINLNPLLKLDGYYLLSDWLEIPNLRQRAFDTLGQRLARFWFGESGDGEKQPFSPPQPGSPEWREQRIYLWYAALTVLFLAWLLTRLLWNVGGALIGRLGGTGALLFLLLAAVAFGPPAARACAACGRRVVRWKEIPMGGRRRLLGAGGALLLGALILALGRWELHLTSPCKLEAAARAAVRAHTDGRVAELTTHEGARVRRGQVVGHLATFEREQRLRERRTQLEITRLQVSAMEDRLPILAAATERDTADAETGAQDSRIRLREERETLPRRVGEAQGRVAAAQAELQAARSRLAEARAAVEAQSRIASRLRSDTDRAVRGDDPPAIAAARELWQRRVVEAKLAESHYRRIHQLVDEGAMAPEQLDTARAGDEAAARRSAEALQAFTAEGKNLREAAEDAENELVRRRATLQAARAAEEAAAANASAARDAARQVASTSRPARLETARLRAAGGAATLAAARAAQRELLARRTEISVKRQEEDRLASQIAILEDQIRRSNLLAPCDGVVTTPRVEEQIGAHFDEGDPVFEVEDPASIFTRIFVNEKELGDIRSGQPVALRVAACPERIYQGQVSEIAPRAEPGGSAAFPTNIVEVRLRVENPTGELRPGMSGWAKIDCGRRPLGAILLRRVTRYLRTEVWSWF